MTAQHTLQALSERFHTIGRYSDDLHQLTVYADADGAGISTWDAWQPYSERIRDAAQRKPSPVLGILVRDPSAPSLTDRPSAAIAWDYERQLFRGYVNVCAVTSFTFHAARGVASAAAAWATSYHDRTGDLPERNDLPDDLRKSCDVVYGPTVDDEMNRAAAEIVARLG